MPSIERLKSGAKQLARHALVPILYHYPPAGLRANRLAIYLKGLVDRAWLKGDVAEIGCDLAGTAIIANRALKMSGWLGTYTCFDTFSGFVPEQFDIDQKAGTASKHRHDFSANSEALIRKILHQNKSDDVLTVKGDITRAPDSAFSPNYIAALIDVDLSVPTYESLKKIYPRLVPGGAIYVDDCPEGNHWKARAGYAQFMGELGQPEVYEHGLGILYKAA